jgi:nucleoside-diphosphate-sugar epimerase
MRKDVIAEDAARVCERAGLAGLRDATVLLTGASGLLGTCFLACLCHLRQSGMSLKVHAQVRSEPAPHTLEIVRRGGFNLLRTDLANYRECMSLPDADVIIHSAGYGQPLAFMSNPLPTIQVNTTATGILLEKLRPGGAFLFVSSSEVYSGLRKPLAQEADIGLTTPLHPRASYIEGKRCGEAICNAYRAKGVRATSARLALAYGPGTRKHDKRAMNSFIENALCRGRIELRDGGKAVRTCCYVSDAVELLCQAALHGTQPVYNVGGHSTATIAELALLIGRLTGAPVVFPSAQAPVAGAPEEVRLDLTLAETEFQKRNYVSLEEGLRATISWQRELYADRVN